MTGYERSYDAVSETERQEDLLKTLLNIQIGGRSAPIEISIGEVIEGFVYPGIVIRKAPPVVIETLARQGWSMAVGPNGVKVLGRSVSFKKSDP